jgi:transposase
MGKIRERRYFDREFKKEAVRLVKKEGTKLSDVARNLEIHPNMLSRWKQEHLVDQNNFSPNRDHMKRNQKELRRLRQEASHLREERDILKKTVAILSKQGKIIPIL